MDPQKITIKIFEYNYKFVIFAQLTFSWKSLLKLIRKCRSKENTCNKKNIHWHWLKTPGRGILHILLIKIIWTHWWFNVQSHTTKNEELVPGTVNNCRFEGNAFISTRIPLMFLQMFKLFCHQQSIRFCNLWKYPSNKSPNWASKLTIVYCCIPCKYHIYQ